MLIAEVSSTGHEREPTFWFGIRDSDAFENSMPSAGLRLSDCVEPDTNHLSCPRTIDLRLQQPTNATSFYGLIQAVKARVQVDPTTRLCLRRIHGADAVLGDDPQQVGLVCSPPAARAHSDRTGHPAQATQLASSTFRTESATAHP